MPKLLCKIIIALLLIINISSCSVVGEYWYERIDEYIAEQFLEYASFSESQEILITKSAKDFKNWNLASELPKYKEFILQFKLLDATTDISHIEELYQNGILLSNESRDFFIPYFIELCESLTNDQIKEIEMHLSYLTEEKKNSLKKEKKNYKEDLEQSFMRLFRLLGVKLNTKQKNIVHHYTDDMTDSRLELIKKREIWDQKLVEIINSKNNMLLEQDLIRHINSIGSEDENTRVAINQITAELIASLDQKQRRRFRNRLDRFTRTIDGILDSDE